MPSVLLAEALLFLGMTPEGTALPKPPAAPERSHVLGGALLLDLLDAGLVALDDGWVAPTGVVATDPVLDAAVKRLEKRRRVVQAVSKLSYVPALSQRLLDHGLLGHERCGFLKSDRYPVLDLARHRDLVAELRDVVTGDGPLGPRDAAFLALASMSVLDALVDRRTASATEAVDRLKRAQAARTATPEIVAVLRGIGDNGHGDHGWGNMPDFDF